MLKRMMQKSWILGIAIALPLGGAQASVPRDYDVLSDTAMVPSLSEIRARRQKELSFDRDIRKLGAAERLYVERLPRLLKKPVQRISNRRYR